MVSQTNSVFYSCMFVLGGWDENGKISVNRFNLESKLGQKIQQASKITSRI